MFCILNFCIRPGDGLLHLKMKHIRNLSMVAKQIAHVVDDFLKSDLLVDLSNDANHKTKHPGRIKTSVLG